MAQDPVLELPEDVRAEAQRILDAVTRQKDDLTLEPCSPTMVGEWGILWHTAAACPLAQGETAQEALARKWGYYRGWGYALMGRPEDGAFVSVARWGAPTKRAST